MEDSAEQQQPARPKKTIDWLAIVIHFICGALFGLVVGISLAVYLVIYWPGTVYHVIAIIGCPLLTGIAAAIHGDRFWHEYAEPYTHSDWRRTPYWR